MLSLLVACGGSSRPAASPTTAPPAANPVSGLVDIGPDFAPVPFAPGTLAATFRAGATITYRIQVPGNEPQLLTTEFLQADDEGVTMRDTTKTADGTLAGEPTTATATWSELEGHAHFPRTATTISDGVIDVPAGHFSAYQYRITSMTDGATAVTTLWFAKELPGPPVKMVKQVDRKTTFEMVLMSTHRPAAE